jgi:hypothetical protein
MARIIIAPEADADTDGIIADLAAKAGGRVAVKYNDPSKSSMNASPIIRRAAAVPSNWRIAASTSTRWPNGN